MANKRITDLPENFTLIGTEALVMDQESTLNASGYDSVQATLSSIQEFTLSAAPFLNVVGDAVFEDGIEVFGDAELNGGATVEQGLSASGEILMTGITKFNGDTTVEVGDFNVTDGQILSGDVDLIDIFGINSFIGSLQQVTDVGNNTTNEILIDGDSVIVNKNGVYGIQRLTQAQYDALTPNPEILYVIIG